MALTQRVPEDPSGGDEGACLFKMWEDLGRKVAKLGLEDSTGGAGLTYLGGLLCGCLRKGHVFASVLHLFISGSLRELPASCQYLMLANCREGRRHDRGPGGTCLCSLPVSSTAGVSPVW